MARAALFSCSGHLYRWQCLRLARQKNSSFWRGRGDREQSWLQCPQDLSGKMMNLGNGYGEISFLKPMRSNYRTEPKSEHLTWVWLLSKRLMQISSLAVSERLRLS